MKQSPDPYQIIRIFSMAMSIIAITLSLIALLR